MQRMRVRRRVQTEEITLAKIAEEELGRIQNAEVLNFEIPTC